MKRMDCTGCAWAEPTPGRSLLSQETCRKAPWVCLPAPYKERLLLKKMCQSRDCEPMGYYQCLSPAELSLPFSQRRRETEGGGDKENFICCFYGKGCALPHVSKDVVRVQAVKIQLQARVCASYTSYWSSHSWIIICWAVSYLK